MNAKRERESIIAMAEATIANGSLSGVVNSGHFLVRFMDAQVSLLCVSVSVSSPSLACRSPIGWSVRFDQKKAEPKRRNWFGLQTRSHYHYYHSPSTPLPPPAPPLPALPLALSV